MLRSKTLVTATAALACLLAGCRSFRDYPPVPLTLQAVEGSQDDASPQGTIQVAGRQPEREDGEGQSPSPKNILVLSGGGMNGAFTAGMLCGWTRSGERPELDVVTGVSTGALIAPFAFLGAEYDDQLKQLYTSKTATHIYTKLPMLFWKEAAASSEPLQRQIQQTVTPRLLERIAEEHRRGRRLYVGTTNLDTQKSVIWDIGGIAAGEDPRKVELVQNVMLASCSVPGLLPPIRINVEVDGERYTELHVDGGVSASMFLPQQSLLERTPEGRLDGPARPTTVYTIVAGKADPDPIPVKEGLLQLTGASLSGILRAQQEHELTQIYLLTYFAKADFRVAAIPQEFATAASSMEFDVNAMRALYLEGYRLGVAAMWGDTPPGIDAEKWPLPRTGTRLVPRSGASIVPDKEP